MSRSFKLALAQLSSSSDREHNLRRCLNAVDEAAAGGARLVLFSEVVLDRFFPACTGAEGRGAAARALAEPIPGPTTEALAAKAREHEMVIVFNLYERHELSDGGETLYFDTSPVLDADGSLVGSTRMVHIPDYDGFHERQYYDAGDRGAATPAAALPVHRTAVGPLGVAICYDRHYPEAWRALALGGAELVAIPQAGVLGEWPEGLFEAEIRAMAFQNGVYAALCNRVGVEDGAVFAGESFVVDPDGRVMARAATLEDDMVFADIDLDRCAESSARRVLLRDRRPELYAGWVAPEATPAPTNHEPTAEDEA
ncbi:MAG: nitrilase-related carbon-nitrogen hydrolase [Acidobacteriota bacterium]